MDACRWVEYSGQSLGTQQPSQSPLSPVPNTEPSRTNQQMTCQRDGVLGSTSADAPPPDRRVTPEDTRGSASSVGPHQQHGKACPLRGRGGPEPAPPGSPGLLHLGQVCTRCPMGRPLAWRGPSRSSCTSPASKRDGEGHRPRTSWASRTFTPCDSNAHREPWAPSVLPDTKTTRPRCRRLPAQPLAEPRLQAALVGWHSWVAGTPAPTLASGRQPSLPLSSPPKGPVWGQG